MSRFWTAAWKVWDHPVVFRLVPENRFTNRISPWLFGKMIGAKGKRIS